MRLSSISPRLSPPSSLPTLLRISSDVAELPSVKSRLAITCGPLSAILIRYALQAALAAPRDFQSQLNPTALRRWLFRCLAFLDGQAADRFAEQSEGRLLRRRALCAASGVKLRQTAHGIGGNSAGARSGDSAAANNDPPWSRKVAHRPAPIGRPRRVGGKGRALNLLSELRARRGPFRLGTKQDEVGLEIVGDGRGRLSLGDDRLFLVARCG